MEAIDSTENAVRTNRRPWRLAVVFFLASLPVAFLGMVIVMNGGSALGWILEVIAGFGFLASTILYYRASNSEKKPFKGIL
jgi:hypothetical protein